MFGIEPEVVTSLAPDGSYDDLNRWVVAGDSVCIVGHEPYLSGYLATKLSTTAREALELSKGGACFIEMEVGSLERVTWLMKGETLAALGRAPGELALNDE